MTTKTTKKKGAKRKPLLEKVTQFPIYLKIGDIQEYGVDKLRSEITQYAKELIAHNKSKK